MITQYCYTMSNQELDVVEEVKDLGVFVTETI